MVRLVVEQVLPFLQTVLFQFQCGAIGSVGCGFVCKVVFSFNSSVVRLVVCGR